MSELDTIESAVEAIRAGRMIIVVDDDDRENEGDLIMAAATATPEQVAFMVRHTSGILCTPVAATGVHRMPLVWRTMNATCSGVAVAAAMIRSPSFSRSASSTTTTSSPRLIASMACSILVNGIVLSFLRVVRPATQPAA